MQSYKIRWSWHSRAWNIDDLLKNNNIFLIFLTFYTFVKMVDIQKIQFFKKLTLLQWWNDDENHVKKHQILFQFLLEISLLSFNNPKDSKISQIGKKYFIKEIQHLTKKKTVFEKSFSGWEWGEVGKNCHLVIFVYTEEKLIKKMHFTL